MENKLIVATSKEAIQTTFTFKNADLNKFSENIAKIAINSIERNVELSKIFGRILETECYKEDGFSSVADFAYKTFGVEKAQAYALANVGKRFFNSNSDTAKRVVKTLNGKTGNLAELVKMSDEDIDKALDDGTIDNTSTQKQLREVANSFKPAKVITEKTCRLSAVISKMEENGKIEVITKDSVIVDNVELLKAIGFSDCDKLIKLYNLDKIVHREGKEDTTKTFGFEAIAYTVDGMFTAKVTVEYIEKPKAPKAPKEPAIDMEEYKAFLKWKESQGK